MLPFLSRSDIHVISNGVMLINHLYRALLCVLSDIIFCKSFIIGRISKLEAEAFHILVCGALRADGVFRFSFLQLRGSLIMLLPLGKTYR